MDDITITLCFREKGSDNLTSINYCPLGEMTYEVSPDNSQLSLNPVPLDLKEGSETLSAAYPVTQVGTSTVGLGVGVYVEINSISNGTNVNLVSETFPRLFSGTLPGEITESGFKGISGGGQYGFSISVVCVPEFTGKDCSSPISDKIISTTTLSGNLQ